MSGGVSFDTSVVSRGSEITLQQPMIAVDWSFLSMSAASHPYHVAASKRLAVLADEPPPARRVLRMLRYTVIFLSPWHRHKLAQEQPLPYFFVFLVRRRNLFSRLILLFVCLLRIQNFGFNVTKHRSTGGKKSEKYCDS